MKISSTEKKKAVPMKLISVPEGLFALREEKKGIREERFPLPEELFSFPEQLFCLRERLCGIPEGLFAPHRDYVGRALAHQCDPPGCSDFGKRCWVSLRSTQPAAPGPHPCYLDLGNTARECADAYRAIVSDALTQSIIDEIRSYLQQQRALGHDAFRSMVEAKTRRFATVRPAHRPKNQPSDVSK